jgi:FKBP-type peptidyl-prolyl cis-trans isomerase FkpA
LNKTIAFTLAALLAGACASAQEAKPTASVPAKAASAEAQPKCQASPKDLVVKDVEPGTGRELIPRASVMVNYTGWLYDGCKPDLKGNMFDTSANRGVPFGVVVGGGKVIKGWDEGLVGMRERGAKRVLIIPPDKGYGEKGAGNVIPPNSTLVFEIETVGIGYYPPDAKK